MKIALVTLLAALLAAQTVHFPGGQALVTASNGAQHVVVKDSRGNVTSDSYCDSSAGTYGQITTFGVALKNAVAAGNRARIAALMHYPLRVNPAPRVAIAGKGALLTNYSDVFTASVLARIRSMEPHEVFCRDGMAMFAGGTVWVQNDRGAIRAAVINR